ncbi:MULTISPECIES: MFS transporter [Rhizobium/Agrobacterium group]|uniref:MFS permease n=2 Tax=Rhizobium/Agrobacterium group TaxID=227290 RepID=B9K2X6_ALLAM|nr:MULTISPECIES: MFS transporter [Rhizobium/Agrobacterium group]ACM39224.1 MFS permease [Allorhizobium ampelinum S4]MCF1445327.1 MFS transporter [Allorhizobium ampelinum]MCF1494217.1 MFS transporter [Allorhizobium ampelinum]MUO27140.1 MFS transporter [Agrobacterium vitis]MUO40558.1 MFS transporter [Agrobacterium vitis]
MPPVLSIIAANPGIRISAIAIFFFGLSGATTAPYMSIIGIHELGLSNAHYSLLIFIASCVNVAASVAVGILADRLGHFRMPMVIVSLFGVVGYGVVFLEPNQIIFVASALVLLPVYNALNSLIFANVRAASKDMPVRELIAVNSGVRAVISASWVLVPGLVGFFLAGQKSMLPAFLFASLGGLACFMLFLVWLPKAEARAEPSASLAFFSSLSKIASPGLLLRLGAIALITAMLQMNGVVLPLVMTGPAHGTTGDVGIIVGIVAFLEIVFILFWGWVERKTSSVATLVAGSLIYCVYLLGLGLASRPEHVYLLSGIAGFGAAAIISVPITYLQNLIADRAGLGSSLIAVNIFLSGGLNSLLFAFGTGVSNYSGTAMLGALAGFCGILLLLILEKPRSFRGAQ